MRESRGADSVILAILSLGILASRLILMYRSGSPEPDSLAMVAGMMMALRGHVPLHEVLLYGREGSPGAYLFGCFVYPLFSNDPTHLLSMLNWITVLASVAMVWPAYGIGRRYLSRPAAAAAVLMVMLAPAVWELSTYFHPEVPAVTLLLLAIWLAGGSGQMSAVRSIGAAILGAAALLCRVHVAFALPGIVLAAFLSSHRKRNLLTVGGAMVLGLAAYGAYQGALSGSGGKAGAGFVGYLSMIVRMYARSFSVAGLTRSVVWAMFYVGVGSVGALALVTWGLARRWRKETVDSRRLYRPVIVGISWALPSVLFWLPQPVPIARHYVLPAFGLALSVATGLSVLFTKRHTVVVMTAIIAATILIPEISYRAYNARHADRIKTPHGAPFYSHEVAQRQIARFDRLADAVAIAIATPGCKGAVVFARWDGYAHLIYALSMSQPDLRPVSTSLFFESVQDRRYRTARHEYAFINYVYFDDPELKQRGLDYIRDATMSAYAVFIPRELADGPLSGMLKGIAVQPY